MWDPLSIISHRGALLKDPHIIAEVLTVWNDFSSGPRRDVQDLIVIVRASQGLGRWKLSDLQDSSEMSSLETLDARVL